jgi:hypothetical protein
MNHYRLAVSAMVLVGFVGAARAELNEPLLESTQAPVSVVQPAPQSRFARAPVVSRRIQPRHAESISLAPPSCGDWLACGQYVIGGIGF